jgi:hypothetical protein
VIFVFFVAFVPERRTVARPAAPVTRESEGRSPADEYDGW